MDTSTPLTSSSTTTTSTTLTTLTTSTTLTTLTTTSTKTKSSKLCCESSCKRRLVLSDFPCGHCSSRYCSHHRQPELHSCAHDFITEGRAQLALRNPRIVSDKLERV